MNGLKEILDREMEQKSCLQNLFSAPDPLQVVRALSGDGDIDKIALICALFSYGNAALIVRFLRRIDFGVLGESEDEISRYAHKNGLKYRFQSVWDVAQILITFKRVWQEDFEDIILANSVATDDYINGINGLIKRLLAANDYRSNGYEFYLSKPFINEPKSPYKRYNMWLRWMVRDSDIDLGIYKKLDKSRLILPLDTHTHKVSLRLGLCEKKSYDFKAAKIITQKLREFDRDDPIKYDFALYRLGQSGEISVAT